MNASVPSANVGVSDYLVDVEVFVDGRVVKLCKEECAFGYRTSAFRDGRHLVLGATFEFPEQDPAESERRRKARMEKVRVTQDRATRNFGSVFSKSNGKIMQLARRTKLGSGGCHFSGKAGNWLVNEGGTFQDAMRAIGKVETLHRLAGKECVREVCVWE